MHGACHRGGIASVTCAPVGILRGSATGPRSVPAVAALPLRPGIKMLNIKSYAAPRSFRLARSFWPTRDQGLCLRGNEQLTRWSDPANTTPTKSGGYFGHPSPSEDQSRQLSNPPEFVGAEALPAGADARAAVPLQSGLRRLRQDRLPRRDPEPAHFGRGR